MCENMKLKKNLFKIPTENKTRKKNTPKAGREHAVLLLKLYCQQPPE